MMGYLHDCWLGSDNSGYHSKEARTWGDLDIPPLCMCGHMIRYIRQSSAVSCRILEKQCVTVSLT